MKSQLIAIVAAVVLVGCGKSSNPAADRALLGAARDGNIGVVKQHIATGTDVNATDEAGSTPLHYAAHGGQKEVIELLIAKGADVNAIGGGHLAEHH